MKKCGLIAFHRAINYGGVLQIYALSEILKEQGLNVEVIDYRSKSIEGLYREISFQKKHLKRTISVFLRNGILKFNVKGFDLFLKNNITLSKDSYTTKTLSQISDSYDFYITGSDQVWSPECAGFERAYFLDFVSNAFKKNSYAASFGSDTIPKNKIDEYKKRICDFNKISVREHSGIKIVKDVSGREATENLDPTMVLPVSKWKEISSKPVGIEKKEKYVLIYMIAVSEDIIKFGKEIAEKKGCKLIYINDNLYKTKGVINARKINPEEWVYLFLNAESIITNSFHGIAFSILFNKEFYVQFLKSNQKINARINNVLEKFSLEDRVINSEDVNLKTIDYKKINVILENEKVKSLSYLKDIIRDKN